jgi:hypothetical protein
MRPGTAIATGCLALLSVLRMAEGAYVTAGLFAVLAVAVVGWGLRSGPRPTLPAELPPASDMRAAWEIHARRYQGWRRIALLGFAISVVGVFVFPPMALVVAGLTLYSVYRMRQSRRSSELLTGVTPPDA